LKEKKEEEDFSLFFPEFEGNPYKVPNLEYDNSSQEFSDWSDEERLLYYARCHLKRIGFLFIVLLIYISIILSFIYQPINMYKNKIILSNID